MNENSNVVALRQPDEIEDPLTDILRSGARQLLAQAVELEAEGIPRCDEGVEASGSVQGLQPRSREGRLSACVRRNEVIGSGLTA